VVAELVAIDLDALAALLTERACGDLDPARRGGRLADRGGGTSTSSGGWRSTAALVLDVAQELQAAVGVWATSIRPGAAGPRW
jgi:hypothetical protein